MLAVHDISMFVYIYNLTAFIIAFICIQEYRLGILSSYYLTARKFLFITYIK
jgi:hypothetical protein